MTKRLSASEQTDLLEYTLKDDNQTGIIKRYKLHEAKGCLALS